MDHVLVLALLLKKSRAATGKGLRQVSVELGVKDCSISNWEDLGNPQFPDESRLPGIAVAYGIPLDLLKKTFAQAKSARRKEVEARRGTRRVLIKSPDCEAYLPGRSGPGRVNSGFIYRNR